MPPFLRTNSQVRNIEWEASYRWDLRFEDAPAPFNEFFPANNVEDREFNLEVQTIEGGGGRQFEIPSAPGANPTITVIFYDDEEHTLLKWLREWVNFGILGGGLWTVPLEDTLRRVDIVKTNSRGNVVDQKSYLVFPKGELRYRGDSESSTPLYSVEFVVAGG